MKWKLECVYGKINTLLAQPKYKWLEKEKFFSTPIRDQGLISLEKTIEDINKKINNSCLGGSVG